MLKKSAKRKPLKAATNSTHSAHIPSKFDAEQSWRGLAARVERLEAWVAKRNDEEREEPEETLTGRAKQSSSKRKRGPKTIPPFELADRRDMLVVFFESNWPELEPLCTPLPDMNSLRQTFQAFANPGTLKTPWGDEVPDLAPGTVGNHSVAAGMLFLPKTLSQLELFLTKQQKRFAANPRQLANAMAGCPVLGFWTSLKRCQSLPYRFGIDQRAMRAYIRRSHPRLYKKLEEPHTLPELAAFCRKYRTRDKNIAGLTAGRLEQLWMAGEHLRNLPTASTLVS